MKRTKKYSDFFASSAKTMSQDSLRKAEDKAQRTILQLRLADLRKQAHIKQTDVPGFSQASISRLEGRTDVKLSTLVDYVHALGMELQIKAIPKKRSAKEI